MKYTEAIGTKGLSPASSIKVLALGLALTCCTSAFALDSNKSHLAENAAVGPNSYLDVGNLTNKTVRIRDIYYALEGAEWAEYTNTWGDGFTLSPGEWSRGCDSLAAGYCYFKGAQFTNLGWMATYSWTNNPPITNHKWKVNYQCEGDSNWRTLEQKVVHRSYWSEALITDCADVNESESYSVIDSSTSAAMTKFMAISPYSKITDRFIVSDNIDRDDPEWNGDYESWNEMTDAEQYQSAIRDMPALKGVSPVLVQCLTTDGKLAKDQGVVLAQNSIAKGCYCNNDDQPDGKSCPDLHAVYYWKIPNNLKGKIDPVGGTIDSKTEKSLHQNKLLQVKTANISNGEPLKEGTRLRLHVTQNGHMVSRPADHVVLAGRQDQWTYALDFAKAVNSQYNVPVSVGERFPDGSIVERGSSYRNWVWGKENYEVSIERADPQYVDTIRGGNLTQGSLVNLEIFNPYAGEMYHFSYIIPNDDAGISWRWTKVLGDQVNAEAAANRYPVRIGEYDSSGKIVAVNSSYRNKLYVGTNEPSQWSMRLNIFAK